MKAAFSQASLALTVNTLPPVDRRQLCYLPPRRSDAEGDLYTDIFSQSQGEKLNAAWCANRRSLKVVIFFPLLLIIANIKGNMRYSFVSKVQFPEMMYSSPKTTVLPCSSFDVSSVTAV